MKGQSLHELEVYVALVAISNFLMGLAMIFRTDDIVRVLKIKTGVKEYERLPLGWRSVIGALFNLSGSFIAVNTGLIGAIIVFSAWREGFFK